MSNDTSALPGNEASWETDEGLSFNSAQSVPSANNRTASDLRSEDGPTDTPSGLSFIRWDCALITHPKPLFQHVGFLGLTRREKKLVINGYKVTVVGGRGNLSEYIPCHALRWSSHMRIPGRSSPICQPHGHFQPLSSMHT